MASPAVLVVAVVFATSVLVSAQDRMGNLQKDLDSLSASLEKEKRNCRNLPSDKSIFDSCSTDSDCAPSGQKGEAGCFKKCFKGAITFSPLHSTFLPDNISPSLPFTPDGIEGTPECPASTSAAKPPPGEVQLKKSNEDYCQTVNKLIAAQSKSAVDGGVCMWVEMEQLPDFKVKANQLKAYHKKLQRIKAGAEKDDASHGLLGNALGLTPKPATASYKQSHGMNDETTRMFMGLPLGKTDPKTEQRVISLVPQPSPNARDAPQLDPAAENPQAPKPEGWLQQVEGDVVAAAGAAVEGAEAVAGAVESLFSWTSLEKDIRGLEKEMASV